MKITYSQTAEDGEKLIKVLVPKFRSKWSTLILIILALVVLFAISDYIAGKPFWGTCKMVSAALILDYTPILPRQFLIKTYDKLFRIDIFAEEKTVETGDNELSVSSPSRFVAYKYQDIQKVELKSPDFVLVHFKHGDEAAFPTHIFKSDEETMEFINIIKSKANIQ